MHKAPNFPGPPEPRRGKGRKGSVSFRENYVHIDLGKGEVVSLEVAQKLLLRAIELCGKHGFLRILAEGDSPISGMNSQDLKVLIKRLELVHGLKLACCFSNYTVSLLGEEFVKLAGEEGTKVRFFDDLDEALMWLGAK